LDWIAFAVVSGAILIETIADLQLHAFLPNRKEGEIMQSGLWKYSRHPNYFGEMSFWIGLMLFGLAAHPEGWWWIMPGGIVMTAMFFFVSIPLIDDRSKENRPGYDEHMKKVSAIIPWFPG
jgi:steroid 5-alpha reductase family enzyme